MEESTWLTKRKSPRQRRNARTTFSAIRKRKRRPQQRNRRTTRSAIARKRPRPSSEKKSNAVTSSLRARSSVGISDRLPPPLVGAPRSIAEARPHHLRSMDRRRGGALRQDELRR